MKILVLQGPNINMLGRRKAEHYGAVTMEEIHERIGARGATCHCVSPTQLSISAHAVLRRTAPRVANGSPHGS